MALYESFQNVISSLSMGNLTQPVFYNSPIGIRFDIGENGKEIYIDKAEDGILVNPDYVATCLERSLNIYRGLKNEPDLLVINCYLYENENITDFISSVISVTDLPQPDEVKQETINEDKNEFVHLFLMWKLKDFSPNKILEEIIKADLGSGYYFLTSSVYFVCTGDNVIFYLYDDRGADLVADKKEKIQHLYYELNDFISDYDKEKIDSIFKSITLG